MPVKIGALLWPQTASWPALRDAAIRADRLGYDSLWTWAHPMAMVGPREQRILEGWATLAGPVRQARDGARPRVRWPGRARDRRRLVRARARRVRVRRDVGLRLRRAA